MAISRYLTAAAAFSMVVAPVAASAGEPVGRVSSATQGTLILRDGKLMPASAGQSLIAGDKVVTRDKARATVKFAGCERAVGSTAILAVSNGCDANAVGLDASTETAGMGNAAVGDTSSVVLGVLALGAVGLGVWAALDGDTDDAPSSP